MRTDQATGFLEQGTAALLEEQPLQSNLLSEAFDLLQSTTDKYSSRFHDSDESHDLDALREVKSQLLNIQEMEKKARQELEQARTKHDKWITDKQKVNNRYKEALAILQETTRLQGTAFIDSSDDKNIVHLCKSIRLCHQILVQSAQSSLTQAQQLRASHEETRGKYDNLIHQYNSEVSQMESRYNALQHENAELDRKYQDSLKSNTQVTDDMRSRLAKLEGEKQLDIEGERTKLRDLKARYNALSIRYNSEEPRSIQLESNYNALQHEHAKLDRQYQDSLGSNTHVTKDLRSRLAKLEGEKLDLEEEGSIMKLDLDRLRQREDEALDSGDRCLRLTEKVEKLELDLAVAKDLNDSLHSSYKATLNKSVKEQSRRIEQLLDQGRRTAEHNDRELHAALESHMDAGFAAYEKLKDQLRDRLADKEREILELKRQVREGEDALATSISVAEADTAATSSEVQKIRDSRDGLEARLTITTTQLRDARADASDKEAIITDLQSRIRQHHADGANPKARTSQRTQSGAPFDPPSPPSSLNHNDTTAKRTSTTAFTPDRTVSKRKAHGRVNDNEGPNRVPLGQISQGPSSDRDIAVSSGSAIWYPEDAASVGCIRINIEEASQEIWKDDVSGELRELVRGYVEWARKRTKTFAIPRTSQPFQCHWHSVARSRDNVFRWHEDTHGQRDHYHACVSCEARQSPCSVLESENILVLLPLHPSTRHDKRPDLGPRDRSYWVNGV